MSKGPFNQWNVILWQLSNLIRNGGYFVVDADEIGEIGRSAPRFAAIRPAVRDHSDLVLISRRVVKFFVVVERCHNYYGVWLAS